MTTPTENKPPQARKSAATTSTFLNPYDPESMKRFMRELDRADGKEDGRIHRPAADDYVMHKAFDMYLKTHPASTNEPQTRNPRRLVDYEPAAIPIGGMMMRDTGTNIYDAAAAWLRAQPKEFTRAQVHMDDASIDKRLGGTRPTVAMEPRSFSPPVAAIAPRAMVETPAPKTFRVEHCTQYTLLGIPVTPKMCRVETVTPTK